MVARAAQWRGIGHVDGDADCGLPAIVHRACSRRLDMERLLRGSIASMVPPSHAMAQCLRHRDGHWLGLAALGLPGTVGFAGEFITFLGAFSSTTVSGIEVYTIIAIAGVVLSAGYILWMIERVFYREPKAKWDHVKDADKVEMISTIALIGVILLVGIYPKLFTDVIDAGMNTLVELEILTELHLPHLLSLH